MVGLKNKRVPHTDFQILLFMTSLCCICGLLLSVIAYLLHTPQEEAKNFDQSRQMLIAAKILNNTGYFEIFDEATEKITPAQYDHHQNILIEVEGEPPIASDEEIKELANARIRPLLTTIKGEISTLEEQKVILSDYLEKHHQTGYASLPYKLFYAILPNESNAMEVTSEEVIKDLKKISVFVIPVSGFGLWGPIYGYLALNPHNDKVIGTTWYEHAETPGLGANIGEPWWQKQFFGKEIFQASVDGNPDLQTSDMGIIVVKGKVSDVYRDSPKARSAVDGISGATLTGDGVTAAYKNSLTPYREFLIKYKENTSND
ncbi:MAG: NADH:ubiquinone reductase (Na(+)-transporting) subunit C [Chlamydiales bacterium]